MTFDEQIAQAFDTLTDRLRGEIDQEVQRRTAEAIAAVPPAPALPPADIAAPPAPDTQAGERLSAAFEAIDRARSLSDVLDTLLSSARAEAIDADLWLLRAGRLYRWRAIGSDDAGHDTPPPLEQGIPLTISGVTVAVLVTEPRTENHELRTANDERRTTNVDLLTRYASRCLEALTAFKTARALIHHDNADRGLRPSTRSGRPGALEGRNADNDPRAKEDPRSEEDASALRYARLLVSEIKLYHESAVIDGRRDRDLATRLGGEIARARAMYEQRVPPHVRDRVDYFQDELIKTLANGDRGLLEVRT
jgi:hypothetical protein